MINADEVKHHIKIKHEENIKCVRPKNVVYTNMRNEDIVLNVWIAIENKEILPPEFKINVNYTRKFKLLEYDCIDGDICSVWEIHVPKNGTYEYVGNNIILKCIEIKITDKQNDLLNS